MMYSKLASALGLSRAHGAPRKGMCLRPQQNTSGAPREGRSAPLDKKKWKGKERSVSIAGKISIARLWEWNCAQLPPCCQPNYADDHRSCLAQFHEQLHEQLHISQYESDQIVL